MICPKCGTENIDGSEFCKECGFSLKEQIEQSVNQQVIDLTNQVQVADSLVNKAFNQYEKGETEYRLSKRFVKNKYYWILMALLIIVGLCVMAASMAAGLTMFIVGVILTVSGIIGAHAHKKKGNEEYQTGMKILDEHETELSVVPADYWFPAAIDYIYRMFTTNRVDTMRQALNLTDTYLHRWKMENNSEELKAINAQIANNTAQIAGNTRSTSIAAWANFFVNL